MPSNVVKTPKQEKLWNEAKQEAKKSKDKPISDFSDRDWGLVNYIYQKKKGNLDIEDTVVVAHLVMKRATNVFRLEFDKLVNTQPLRKVLESKGDVLWKETTPGSANDVVFYETALDKQRVTLFVDALVGQGGLVSVESV